MDKQRYSQKSIKVSADLKRKKGIKVLVYITGCLILVNLLPFVGNIVVQGRDTYIPATPFGPVYGFVDVEYEYLIYSANSNAFWMFDWGDGTFSDWLSLEEPSNVITQSHTWSIGGEYQIRVHFRSDFFKNGVWSEPLTVMIELDSDSDMLSDTVESSLGSNPQNLTDVTKVRIAGGDYYIVITETNALLYHPLSGNLSLLTQTDEGMYLIDYDMDSVWDYVFDPVLGSINKFVELPPEESSLEIPWPLFMIIGAIIGGILVILVLIKTGVIYIYEEYIVEE